MGKVLAWVVLVAVILGLGYAVWLSRGERGGPGRDGGQIVVSVTDPSADMGAVAEVTLAVSRFELYATSTGWVTVSDADRSFGLLALDASGESALYAATHVEEGSYSRVRVTWGDATVTLKDGTTTEALVAGHQLEAAATVTVAEGESAHVGLAVNAAESLFVAADGSYVLAPVVDVESRRGAGIAVSGEGIVTVTGGRVESSVNVGTGLDGVVAPSLRVNPGVRIDVENGVIEVPGGSTRTLVELKG